VKPTVRRAAAAWARQTHGIGVRRACGLVGVATSGLYRVSRRRDDHALREAIRGAAQVHRRWGVRRIRARLRREGWPDNHKRVERIYREEGLQVRRRRRKRAAAVVRQPLAQPTGPNQLWAMRPTVSRRVPWHVASGGGKPTVNALWPLRDHGCHTLPPCPQTIHHFPDVTGGGDDLGVGRAANIDESYLAVLPVEPPGRRLVHIREVVRPHNSGIA